MATLAFIPTHQLLETPIPAAGFSEPFAETCRRQGWLTLGDIVRLPLIELLQIPGYLPQCHQELVRFLGNHHRLHLLDVSY
ncbi:hypothetical protein [Parapedobacter sp.]